MILLTLLRQGSSSYSCKWKAGLKALGWWFPIYFITAVMAFYFAFSGQLEHLFMMVQKSLIDNPPPTDSSAGLSPVSHALEIVLPMFFKIASWACSFFFTARIFAVVFFPQTVAQEFRKEAYSEHLEAEKQKQLYFEEKKRLSKALPDAALQRSHKRL